MRKVLTGLLVLGLVFTAIGGAGGAQQYTSKPDIY